MLISARNRAILRDLAKRQAELAASPGNRRPYPERMDCGGAKPPASP